MIFQLKIKEKDQYGELSNRIEIGDIVQLSFDGIKFTHSLIVVKLEMEKIFTASHTFDSYERPINTYMYNKIRFIHILGVQI